MQNVFLCKEDISKVKFATQFAWTCNTVQSYAKHGLIWGISLMHPGPPFFSWHFIAASLMASPSLAHLSRMQSRCFWLNSDHIWPFCLPSSSLDPVLGVDVDSPDDGGVVIEVPFDGAALAEVASRAKAKRAKAALDILTEQLEEKMASEIFFLNSNHLFSRTSYQHRRLEALRSIKQTFSTWTLRHCGVSSNQGSLKWKKSEMSYEPRAMAVIR